MAASDSQGSARNYPLAWPEADPRFTFGLQYEIKQVIEAHGYPVLTGRDMVELGQALFAMLYAAPDADPDRHAPQAGRSAAQLAADRSFTRFTVVPEPGYPMFAIRDALTGQLIARRYQIADITVCGLHDSEISARGTAKLLNHMWRNVQAGEPR